MLHDPARHEPPANTPWDEAAARAAIERIVRDAEAGFVDGRAGRPRHSLWTGDIRLALYLRDCLRARAEFPTLDVF